MQHTHMNSTILVSRTKLRVHLAGLCLAAGLAATPTAFAGGLTAPKLSAPIAAISLSTTDASAETIALITGLIGIERDLLLGQLFLQGGMVSAEGSHFTHPRRDNFPAIKDGLAAAGAPDLEPLLIALEGATEKGAVNEAYLAVLAAVLQAKQSLQPTEQDVLAAVIGTTEAAAAMLDPSGTTDVIAYQEAWGLLMAARGQIDTMISSVDPAVKKSATKMALDFDEVILFAPDPAASAPVAFDPALITTLVATLKGEIASI
jgi:hypothetical protein